MIANRQKQEPRAAVLSVTVSEINSSNKLFLMEITEKSEHSSLFFNYVSALQTF